MTGLRFVTIAVCILVFRALSVAAPPAPPGFSLGYNVEKESPKLWNELARQIGERAELEKLRGQIWRPDLLPWASDRDPADMVLRRTEALWKDLVGRKAELAEFEPALRALKAKNAEVAPADLPARKKFFAEICLLRRKIAFANPLLDFDQILFVKTRKFSGHCCDQYHGFHARPFGGLYVLKNPFGADQSVRDVLADSVVGNGRLKGQKLRGAFMSAALSYDAQTIAFAHSEAGTTEGGETAEKWSPQRSWHIFTVKVDGSELRQLTDGPWNDFHPCFLPNGRIAFISERRGGFGRCHARPVPTYTLHSMKADGSDIACLSFHDTNEWNPSVMHDGMIVYSRWDYVDRGAVIAHHPWITTPDGRDARALQGNYPLKRELRPDMEAEVRAIPGSHRFVATTAGHHGATLGSLVIIDPRVPDDDMMAAVKRLTPWASFPEVEKRTGPTSYYTPWPLDEDYYLCSDTGCLVLLDGFGNVEYLTGNSFVPQNPIPLRPTPRPPIVPEQSRYMPPPTPRPTDRPPPPPSPEQMGTVAVTDVYNSRTPWPADTRITALRIIQVLPKTTPVAGQPNIGVAGQTLARTVLGTVPVEADGSAHFELPAGKAVYFQALDERGLAVQSMRSDTYVHPGERLVCGGCHEERHRVAPALKAPPLAFRRAPSRIEPDVEGSNPFNFVRLVQPAIERSCMPCHREKHVSANLSFGGMASYGFHFGSGAGNFNDPFPRGGSRTVMGKFGARASKMLAVLDDANHRGKVPYEDFHRVTLWIDANCAMLGSYEEDAKQRRGEIVWPSLE